MIERPHGGLSFVLADGQGHGPAANHLSHLVATKAVSLLADGVRDGAAARATHDFLYAYRQGKVSADLTIVSVDLASKTIVLSRNCACPLIILSSGETAPRRRALTADRHLRPHQAGGHRGSSA